MGHTREAESVKLSHCGRPCQGARIKKLKRLLLVNHKAQVIDIKQDWRNVRNAKRPNGEPSPTSGALFFWKTPNIPNTRGQVSPDFTLRKRICQPDTKQVDAYDRASASRAASRGGARSFRSAAEWVEARSSGKMPTLKPHGTADNGLPDNPNAKPQRSKVSFAEKPQIRKTGEP